LATVEAATATVAAALAQLAGEADRFRALDAEVGDGDLGVTVAAGAAAVRAALAEAPPADFGELFATVGRSFAAANPSTMANLVGIALRRVSRAAGDATELGGESWAELLAVAIAAIEKRGGAALGDKTILDALEGSRAALAAAGGDGDQALTARDGAVAAADTIAPLAARAGRASWQGERTRGARDPGAEVWVATTEALAATPE
jgi:dihydroxyacetone kinase